jgi:K+-sensing histidine kinase KdpD
MVSNDVTQIQGSVTGIPREMESKLIEPFVRVNNLHDDRYHRDTFGMGTGLTMIYHAIFKVNGKLYLYESHNPLSETSSKKVIAEMIFPFDRTKS